MINKKKLMRNNDLLGQSSTETLLDLLKAHAGIKECSDETVMHINGVSEVGCKIKLNRLKWAKTIPNIKYSLFRSYFHQTVILYLKFFFNYIFKTKVFFFTILFVFTSQEHEANTILLWFIISWSPEKIFDHNILLNLPWFTREMRLLQLHIHLWDYVKKKSKNLKQMKTKETRFNHT